MGVLGGYVHKPAGDSGGGRRARIIFNPRRGARGRFALIPVDLASPLGAASTGKGFAFAVSGERIAGGSLYQEKTRKPRDGLRPSSRGFLSLRSVVAYGIVALVLSGPPCRASRLRLRRLVSDCTYSAARAKQIS